MRLLRLLLVVYLLALGFIVFYKYRYWYEYKIIPLHLLVVSIGVLALFLLSLAFSFIGQRAVRVLLFAGHALISALAIWGLCIAYGIIIAGKKFGIGVLPLNVIFDHLRSPAALLSISGISPLKAYATGAILLILVLLTAAYLYTITPDAIKGLKNYTRRFASVYTTNSPKSKRRDLAVVILFLVCCVVLQWRQSLYVRLQFCHEPISTMIFGETQFMGMFHLASYKEPDSIRALYPRRIPFQKRNVILIICDAMRADHVGSYGYDRPTSPFLKKMCDEGKLVQVPFAFSTSAASFPGILSTLRSKPMYDLAYHNFSLQDLLHDQGYKVHFILSGDHDNWYDMKYFYGSGVDHYYDGRHSKRYVGDDELLLDALDQVSAYSDTPAMFYFHLMSTHYGGLKHEQYVKWTPASVESDSIPYQNNYDNGVLQADHYIQKLFEKLEAKGYLKNSIVVITADHGESLGERGYYGHVQNVYSEEIRIPLWIYDSDSLMRVQRHFAEQPDIAATIVDRLGLPVPPSWTGRSLLRPAFDTITYHSINYFYAAIDYQEGRVYKYLYNSDTKKEELYDDRHDPRELHDIIKQADPVYIAKMRERINAYITAHGNY